MEVIAYAAGLVIQFVAQLIHVDHRLPESWRNRLAEVQPPGDW